MLGVICLVLGLVAVLPVWLKYHSVLNEINRDENNEFSDKTPKCTYGYSNGPELCKAATDWFKAAVILSWIDGLVGLIFVVILIIYSLMKC